MQMNFHFDGSLFVLTFRASIFMLRYTSTAIIYLGSLLKFIERMVRKIKKSGGIPQEKEKLGGSSMKKNQLLSGIRIPQHKQKRMLPLPVKDSDVLDLPRQRSTEYSLNLHFNFDFFPGDKVRLQDDTAIIETKSWKEMEWNGD